MREQGICFADILSSKAARKYTPQAYVRFDVPLGVGATLTGPKRGKQAHNVLGSEEEPQESAPSLVSDHESLASGTSNRNDNRIVAYQERASRTIYSAGEAALVPWTRRDRSPCRLMTAPSQGTERSLQIGIAQYLLSPSTGEETILRFPADPQPTKAWKSPTWIVSRMGEDEGGYRLEESRNWLPGHSHVPCYCVMSVCN